MKLPVYSKIPNKDCFEARGTWKFRKGWYDDGVNQFIVEFEFIENISSFWKHYYRFPLFGQKTTNRYYWLILNPLQQICFNVTQEGLIKTLFKPLLSLVQLVKSFGG